MPVIYGWSYAEFHSNVGWEKGTETVYNFWENYWATQADAYIFSEAGTHITDADEMKQIQTLINSMMILTNLYLKGEVNETPMQSGFYDIGFPQFIGDPMENNGMGSGDYIILNKYKRKYDLTFARADSIRIGVDPANVYFRRGGVYF